MDTGLEAAAGRPLVVHPDAFRPDPHAGFARYRPLAALIDLGGDMPLAIRAADVDALTTDPRTRQLETEALERRDITGGALHAFCANSMLLANPPAHFRRRTPAVRAFGFRLVQAWRPRIRVVVGDLVDSIDTQEFELQEAVASPLPARLIAEILGAPVEDAPHFAARVYGMARGLSAFRPAEYPGIEQAAGELFDYVARLLEERRQVPRDDFLTAYLRRVDELGELSTTETIVQVVTLIIAGSETTRFALTALISLLLQHRAQWDAVCRDPGLAPAAVSEALRFEPPVGSIGRVVTEPFTLEGIPLPLGTVLGLSLISAQRDERVYRDPHRFDIARTDHPRRSLSFGGGAHHCLGEALARAELEEALVVLSQRLPALSPADGPAEAWGHSGIRGISPLRLRAGGKRSSACPA
jgi:hypothetical protein